jgi:sialidase-1
MNRIIRNCFLLLLLGASFAAIAQKKDATTWHGFKRVNFKIDTISAYIVVPEKPLPGNPWLWRSFSPDFHTDIDSLLVTRGFYIAFLDVDSKQLYGQPSLMDRWEKFYNYLVKEKQFSAKPALTGAVRGTLCEFAWAKLHPDKVSCIYCENPVADVKNWPGSKGSGTGGAADQWKQFLAAYAFTDAQGLQYGDSPKDNLAPLATAKLPLYFSFGLHDGMIPMEENALVIANNYIKLGGPITVHPMTIGKQEANGHHVTIENPAEIADFIYRNSTK